MELEMVALATIHCSIGFLFVLFFLFLFFCLFFVFALAPIIKWPECGKS